MYPYFTDREFGPQPRASETVNQTVWGGIYALLSARLADESFGLRFPDQCPDGYGVCGCNQQMFRLTLEAQIPQIAWPLSPGVVPETPVILDLLEFCAASIGKPIEGYFHSYFRHSHLDFDREAGLSQFIADVNFIFSRNGIAYELAADGTARRILPDDLHQVLIKTLFQTGDNETDRLLESARKLFISPHLDQRRDALEKIWDAFERLKTLEPVRDKRAQADALLDKAVPAGQFRALLGNEADVLTKSVIPSGSAIPKLHRKF